MIAMGSMSDMPQTAVSPYLINLIQKLKGKLLFILVMIECLFIIIVADLCHKFAQNLVDKKQVGF